MTANLNHIKYLFPAALFILIALCGYFHFAFEHMNKSLVQEKCIGRQMMVNLICDRLDKEVAVNNDWGVYNYQEMLSYTVSQIDAATGTYAELFDENLNCLSPRTLSFENNPFGITAYPEVLEQIKAQPRGNAIVGFAKDAQSDPHEVHLYWRWVPTDPSLRNKFLVVLGTSKYSLDVGFADWIIYGLVVAIVISALFILACIVMLCQLGHIYKSREGECRWRSSNYLSP